MINSRSNNIKKIFAVFIFVIILFLSNNVFADSFYEFNGRSLIPAETFISEDIKSLDRFQKIEEVYDEIRELNKLEKQLLTKYIPTHSGVKLYDPVITEQIHAINGALYYRWEIINKGIGEELEIRENQYFADNPYTKMKIKGRSSRSEVEAALIEAKRVLNYIEIDTQYTDGVLMFISPYHLEGALGFAHSYKHGNNWIRTAVIGGRLNNTYEDYTDNYYLKKPVRVDQETHMAFRNTILHELGHTVDNLLKVNNKEFKETYYTIYPEMLGGHVGSWEFREQENFAEDFKVFFSDKLGRMSNKIDYKKTAFKYDKRVDELFNELLESKIKEG